MERPIICSQRCFMKAQIMMRYSKKRRTKVMRNAIPEADVEGHDACRKIAILSSLISGQQVDFEDIYTEGITEITKEDMMYAKAMKMTIKLLASSRRDGDHLHAIVAPHLFLPIIRCIV